MILRLTAAASSQIAARFNLLAATEVSGEDADLTPLTFPMDAEAAQRGFCTVSRLRASTGRSFHPRSAPGVLVVGRPHVELVSAFGGRIGSWGAVVGPLLAGRLGHHDPGHVTGDLYRRDLTLSTSRLYSHAIRGRCTPAHIRSESALPATGCALRPPLAVTLTATDLNPAWRAPRVQSAKTLRG